ncbi:MAG: hypothetical protein JSR53_13505 [Proteobacteria bacterium]|nr:hypothetical protein [Pseudomonadota bacterium]
MNLFFLTSTLAIVIPAQAGIQCPPPSQLDSRLRGNDGGGAGVVPWVHRLRAARGAMDT